MSPFARVFRVLLHSLGRLDPRIRPKTRANEVASLRLRLLSEATSDQASPREVELARALCSMRERMLTLIGEVEACRSCGKGYPLPNGRWDGGYCCGGTTENLFKQEEIACMRCSGTQPADLRPPRDDHAGCSFRGRFGCSLAPAHRPNLCVRYACRMLSEEYERRGIATEVRALASEMQRTFGEFQELRSKRLEDESLARFQSASATRHR